MLSDEEIKREGRVAFGIDPTVDGNLMRFARAVERAAYERAAQWVDKRAEDYDAEHGLTDPETGSREYPGNGDEYVFELHEIADGLRALKEPQ